MVPSEEKINRWEAWSSAQEVGILWLTMRTPLGPLLVLLVTACACGRLGFELGASADASLAGDSGAAADADAAATDAGASTDAGEDAGDVVSNCGTGRPGPSNTGFIPGSLVPMGNIVVTAQGTVIENVDVSGGITVQADDVTIRNFRVTTSGPYGIDSSSGATNLVIEHGEISGATSAGILGADLRARCLELHDMERGIIVQNNTVVEDSWFHSMNSHAVFSGSGAGGAFRRNYCLLTTGGACVFLSDVAAQGGYRIEDNWLDGGSYTVYCHEETTVSGNRFGRGFVFGLRSGPCLAWTDNVWDDTGLPVP